MNHFGQQQQQQQLLIESRVDASESGVKLDANQIRRVV